MEKVLSYFQETPPRGGDWGTYTLAVLGTAWLGSYAVSFGKMVFDLARPGISLSKFGAKKGAWAVVTGPTSGIGLEFAKQLAKAGFNILLVGRDATLMQTISSEISSQTSVQVQAHQIDFGKASDDDYTSLRNKIDQVKTIGVLVNNVGVGHHMPVPFEQTPDDEMDSIIAVNVRANLKITKMVVPHMTAAHKGLILNVGSFSALVPTPLLATYAGSKGFLFTWSQALGTELADKGVVVQLLNTYFVVSKLSKIRRASWLIPAASTYVRSVLSHVGRGCGAVAQPYVSTPYFPHALANWIVDHVGPTWAWLAYNKSMQKGIRARALKKATREAKAQ